MGRIFLERLGVMALSLFCLTFIVFSLLHMEPNLEKLAKVRVNQRMSDADVASWLQTRGYMDPHLVKYGRWLGVTPGWVHEDADGNIIGQCIDPRIDPRSDAPQTARYCGLLQGELGYSAVMRTDVSALLASRLAASGKLIGFVLLIMIPAALLLGVFAGMREGSKLDRGLSSVAITSTATPEYVSGIILSTAFATPILGMQWFKGSATSAIDDATFANFTLPVITIALFGMGYIARMTRASMAEVMTAQYIRTAKLKGVSFFAIVFKHALRNALIAPFTVIMLQIPWLLNGVVIVELLFNYKGFGWLLITAAGNNDIELLLAISMVSVVIVLLTQLISDIGYAYLNPRIRLS